MQKRLPKTSRAPGGAGKWQITDRTLEVLKVIAAYRFIPTSLILALTPGNDRVTQLHLQRLFHDGLVNRFPIRRGGRIGQFVYYLDDKRTLRLLEEAGGAPVTDADLKTVRNNRERGFAGETNPGDFLFIDHELMVSRFHAMVDLACRASGGEVELASWRQDDLKSRVETPLFKREGEGWYESGETEALPHEPDAFFTLRFPGEPEGRQLAHFFYEADRQTMAPRKMRRKFRAHFHFVVRRQLQRDKYRVRRIRAVLVETLTMDHAQKLREAAAHPEVSGRKPSELFWFTPSEVLVGEGKRPRFLEEPGLLLQPVWATAAHDRLVSLRD